jgi:hypothetical protein
MEILEDKTFREDTAWRLWKKTFRASRRIESIAFSIRISSGRAEIIPP